MGNQTEYQMKELLPLVSELAQKYTGFESTSIPYEKAQMLMEAVLYCLREYDSGCPDSESLSRVGHKGSVREKYEAGQRLLLEKVEKIRVVFNEVSLKFEDYGVQCLSDTVQRGIPEFLKWYDAEFCPQDTILTLDYPLLTDLGALCGADAVYAYICGIQKEQQFLAGFGREYVMRLLEAYHPDFQELIENICGIVLANTVGHILLQKPLSDDGFQKEEYQKLLRIFNSEHPGGIKSIEHTITCLIQQMVGRYYGNDGQLCAYLCAAANDMAVRIHAAAHAGALE